VTHTLLLQLVAPMQSWGTQSRFTDRDTGLEPSKSAVIGLLCAALGRDRAEPVEDLASLRMGVRVDREGVPETDYHTAQGVPKAGNSRDTSMTVVSRRHYLADAIFLVGFEGEDHDLLNRLAAALDNPVWPLYLGRKSFTPAARVHLGLRENIPLERALADEPPLDPRGEDGPRRTVIEVPFGEHDGVRNDSPVSFDERSFLPRYVRFGSVSPTSTVTTGGKP